MLEKNKNIMVYMGSYVYKDRGYGKDYYVTYDGDINASHKSYFDLKTGDVCNIDIELISEFERNNFIINIPVTSYSYDSYLVNYNKLKDWFLKQLNTRSEEEVIEELRQKYENKLEIDQLRKTREDITNLNLELSKIEEERTKILKKIKSIWISCSHEIIVKTQDKNPSGNYFNKAYCLICNQMYSAITWTFDSKFENIIHLEDKEFSNLTEDEKMKLAFEMFEEEREKNPELSDSRVVEIINDRLKNEIKGKVLSNKPGSEN